MELELGLAPPTNTAHLLGELSGAAGVSASAACRGKRGFGEAFDDEEEAATTLPLFDDGSSSSSSSSSSSGGSRENKKALVGWPPVSSARSRACGVVGGRGHGRHVKVRKEGAAIGRKVDISLHGSYGELRATLARMFPEPITNVDGGSSDHGGLVVTYEDADGDWMLVGDVPWE